MFQRFRQEVSKVQRRPVCGCWNGNVVVVYLALVLLMLKYTTLGVNLNLMQICTDCSDVEFAPSPELKVIEIIINCYIYILCSMLMSACLKYVLS